MEIPREHGLTIFLAITGIGSVPRDGTKQQVGQVVGNIVSEWRQIRGLVLMRKRLMEVGSKQR